MIYRVAVSVLAMLGLSACMSEADMVSRNLSKDAEEFKVVRRVAFYDSIQGVQVLSITGRCSVERENIGTTVTCKANDGTFLKHFLGHADNMTFFAEQLHGAAVSTAHYKVLFRPSALIPDIDLK